MNEEWRKKENSLKATCYNINLSRIDPLFNRIFNTYFWINHIKIGQKNWFFYMIVAHHKRFLNNDNGNRKLLALLMKICKTISDDSADFLKSHNFIDIMQHDVKLRVITLPLHWNHSNTNHNYKNLNNGINTCLWHCLDPSYLLTQSFKNIDNLSLREFTFSLLLWSNFQ